MATQNRYGRIFHSKDDKKIKEEKEITKKELSIVLNYLEDRYAIDSEVLKDYIFLKKGDDLWIASKKVQTIFNAPKELKINSIGFRAIRNYLDANSKITTNFAQLIGKHMKKNTYTLSDNELEEYTHGYNITIKENLHGYVVLKYRNEIVGVGLSKNYEIKNQIPKGRVLKNTLVK